MVGWCGLRRRRHQGRSARGSRGRSLRAVGPAAVRLERQSLSAGGAASVDVDGITLGLPARRRGRPCPSRIAFYAAAAPASRIAVQSFDGGVRALIKSAAPRRPSVRVPARRRGRLAQPRAGRARDDARRRRTVIGVIDAPWGTRREGARRCQRITRSAGSTLVQVVEHRGRGFAYGITADPSIWKIAKCGGVRRRAVLRRREGVQGDQEPGWRLQAARLSSSRRQLVRLRRNDRARLRGAPRHGARRQAETASGDGHGTV